MLNSIKKLSYHPAVKWLVQTFHLQTIGRKLYYRWRRPKDGVMRIQVGDVAAEFHVRSASDLRMIEGLGGEPQIVQKVVSRLRPSDVVLDIGASLGLYTVLMAKAVGEQGMVAAFEPEQASWSRLRENVQLNRLGNVRCFRKAVAAKTGAATLYFNPGEEVSARIDAFSKKKKSYQQIEMVAGDDFLQKEGLPAPGLVKIDVEGYEYEVLKGLQGTLTHLACHTVCCEVHPALLPSGTEPAAVLRLLRSLGFTRVETFQRGKQFHCLAYKASSGDGGTCEKQLALGSISKSCA